MQTERVDTSKSAKDVVKVVHVAPTPFFADRGCHMRIRGIISGLNELSVQNVLCTYHLGRDVPNVAIRRAIRVPGYRQMEAGPSPFKYLADLLLFGVVIRTVWKERPDIIHGHLHEGILLGWAVRTLFFWRRKPALIFDVQGSLVGELAAHGYFDRVPQLKWIFTQVEHLICRLPDVLICSSIASAQILRSEFGIAEESIAVVGDGFDIVNVAPNKVERLRSRLGIPKDRQIVIYTGALLPYKGTETLKAVLLAAKKTSFEAHFLIVGYPDEEIRRFVERHSLETVCSVVGAVQYDELSLYLALANVGVEPKDGSSGEASGKVLNYMGAGLPVVCFDTEINRSLLGDFGYFATDNSAEAFLDQIMTALQEPDLAAQNGAFGRERAQRLFSWTARSKKVLSIYQATKALGKL